MAIAAAHQPQAASKDRELENAQFWHPEAAGYGVATGCRANAEATHSNNVANAKLSVFRQYKAMSAKLLTLSSPYSMVSFCICSKLYSASGFRHRSSKQKSRERRNSAPRPKRCKPALASHRRICAKYANERANAAIPRLLQELF